MPCRRVMRCADGQTRIWCCIEHQFIALRALLLNAASMRTAPASDASGALPAL
ncbi:putative uncharacterized protein [Xanthomonas citri pv. mangiferaeindicae LMG 941]|nr:putative uncharacterized protein [Xanthomonas citri pv. mangiferaeindicae LMG 941]